jgi:hypothetical protein
LGSDEWDVGKALLEYVRRYQHHTVGRGAGEEVSFVLMALVVVDVDVVVVADDVVVVRQGGEELREGTRQGDNEALVSLE